MRARFLLLLCLTAIVSVAYGQYTRFPLGPWQFKPPQNPNWAQERAAIATLGVSELFGMGIDGMTMASETLSVREMCDATGGTVKATCFVSPNVVAGGRTLWAKMAGWAPGYPPGCNWRDTIKTYLRDIRDTYDGRPVIGSMLMAHEWFGGGAPDIHDCDSLQWHNVLQAVDYACAFWRDSLGYGEDVRNSSIYIMPVDGFGGAVPHLSMSYFLSELNHLGIYEHDHYPFRPYIPSVYSLNSDSFLTFQNCLGGVVSLNDSCYKYFENPFTKGNRNTRWTAIIQALEQQQLGNGPIDIRWPTKEEVNCQAWLALSRGAKGIKYFTYFTGGNDNDYRGLVTGNRTPRNRSNYPFPWYPDSAPYRIFDWYSDLNGKLSVLGPILINTTCDYAFGVNYRYGQPTIPAGSYVRSVLAANSNYRQYNYFEVACLSNISGEDYFMLVNRYCQPEDTVTVNVTLNYMPSYFGADYFIVDASNNSTISEILPRGVDTSVTITLLPGSGRLLKLVPFGTNLVIDHESPFTNFRFSRLNYNATGLYSTDSIEITRKFWFGPYSKDGGGPDGHWDSTSTGWMPYSCDSTVVYLDTCDQDSVNIISVRCKIEGAKITTPKVSASILYNCVAPTNGSVVINNGAVYTNNRTVQLKLSGQDAVPGLYKMRYLENLFNVPGGFRSAVTNGTFGDTTGWETQNASCEYGFLRLWGRPDADTTVITASATCRIPDTTVARLRNVKMGIFNDVYSQGVAKAQRTLDLYYADTLVPHSIRISSRDLSSQAGGYWRSPKDTVRWTYDTTRPVDRMELAYAVYGGISVPPPPPGGPVCLEYTMNIDNVRLAQVTLTGEDYWSASAVDTSNSLPYTFSLGEGVKRIFMQLKDSSGNISPYPGWRDTIVLDTAKPYANITNPTTGSYINGTINVYAHAGDSHFQGWVLGLKAIDSTSWTTLNSGTSQRLPPAKPMQVYYWNTTTVPDGEYSLRLTSTDSATNAKADTHVVYVNNGESLAPEGITAEFITLSTLPSEVSSDGQGNLYVNDTTDNTVRAFTPEGTSIAIYDGSAAGFSNPEGAGIDVSGNIWLADGENDRMLKMSPEGAVIGSFGQHGAEPGRFNLPCAPVVAGDRLYVVDKKNNRVQVFSSDGDFIRAFGQDQLDHPSALSLVEQQTNDGIVPRVLVTDTRHDRIAVFDTAGGYVDSMAYNIGLQRPRAICVDQSGDIYVADVQNHRVVVLNRYGDLQLAFGVEGQTPGRFKKPKGLALSPDGKYLYVSDSHNGRVQRVKVRLDEASGGFNMSGRHQSPVMPVSYTFELQQSTPNPFNKATEIKYQLPEHGKVSLQLFNINGQLVKTLVAQHQAPGAYTVRWDGKDDHNANCATGVYLYRLQAGSRLGTRKIVLVK